MKQFILLLFSGLLLTLSVACNQSQVQQPDWPDIAEETKPWTRWWWMGSSVEEADLSALMQEYWDAGLGGVEITPIYGVHGYEKQFIDYLAPDWTGLLEYTIQEAHRIGLGVDMATGTGWPFGGPWIGPEHACKRVEFSTYKLEGGERLSEPVEFIQQPMARAVRHRVDMDTLAQPVSANDHLQAMALEQVRFEEPLPLQTLMAYSEDGKILDLTDKVDTSGTLDWTAPAGNWMLYAVFQGWHGKMVERAGPGGEGNVIDHFSDEAILDYLRRFDSAFAETEISGLRGFFNDSYEVDDASGQANWTPELFAEFEERHGYDLREELPALFGEDNREKNRRVRSDYRETISDLLLVRFTDPWREWAHGKEAIIRNQAHGSPANILDLYAASDIPETEGTDILRAKFATSAANISGKRLVSSESATWLNEHFRSTLADVKRNIDRYFLAGVNHIFYHGTAYSSPEEEWPGWLFYAAVHFNERNSWWDHFSALNHYVARVQSFLQAGMPDNDILLYFPIYDRYAESGGPLLEHFDGQNPRKTNTAFGRIARWMQEQGYAYDFISDQQIMELRLDNGAILSGESGYQVILVPGCEFMPLETFRQLLDLAKNGASILFFEGLPEDVPGWGDLQSRQELFRNLRDNLDLPDPGNDTVQEATSGQGRFLIGQEPAPLLRAASVRRESMIDSGLQYVRRRFGGGHVYYIVNWSEEPVSDWIPFQSEAESAVIFNPTTDKRGIAAIRESGQAGVAVFLQLQPGEACLVQTFQHGVNGEAFKYFTPSDDAQPLEGEWTVEFVQGGPELPETIRTTELESWTEYNGDAVRNFSGTGRYTIEFETPDVQAEAWTLDLGTVYESARVWLNGEELGTVIGPVYQVIIDNNLLRQQNELSIEVANLMANRIAYLDRNNVGWKKFYNINFPAREGENRNDRGLFDASGWTPEPSGLIGPVELIPLELTGAESL